MVAAISRLASLLKQATAGDVPLPTAKPDPAKTELIKTLVVPRAPHGAEPMPSLAPPLVVPTKAAMAQKEASSQILQAYRAALDLEEIAPASVNQRSSSVKGAGAEAETAARAPSAQPAGPDGALSGARVPSVPGYVPALPLAAIARQIEGDEASTRKRRPVHASATRGRSGETSLETVVSARAIAFGLAAFALLLLIVLLVF
jgi:hypothetical protein